jgi:hypothetical protein
LLEDELLRKKARTAHGYPSGKNNILRDFFSFDVDYLPILGYAIDHKETFSLQ